MIARILISGLVLSFTFLGCMSKGDIPEKVVKSRNIILFITIDTLNPKYLGCYGDPETRSPVIDHLARSGLSFSQCHSVINITGASFASLISGVPPYEHKVFANGYPIAEGFQTLGESFQSDGFATVGVVSSFHLNPDISNLAQGFSDFFTCEGERIDGADATSKLTAWLKTHPAGRQMIWLHYYDCHTPYNPPWPYSEFYLMTEDPELPGETLLESKPFLQQEEVRKWFQDWLQGVKETRTIENRYRGTISEIDYYCETILTLLKQMGRYDEMVVVLTSDHGESFGEHGVYFDHRGPYEPNIDIPFIVSGPGLPENRVLSGLVSGLDIPPTLLDLMKIPIPPSFRGYSVLPLIDGHTQKIREFMVTESLWQNAITIRDQTNKLTIPLHDVVFYPKSPELFRISEDLTETDNLVNQHPVLVKQMTDTLRNYTMEINATSAGYKRPNTPLPDTVKKLEALGYIQK